MSGLLSPGLSAYASRWGRALFPLLLATLLYVAFLVGTQPIFSSDRSVVVNPTPMLYGVALIRTPARYRAWLFPFVIAATFASIILGGGGVSLADPVKIVGHATSRALGMFVFMLLLDRLAPEGIDIRRPEHVVALASAMVGSLLFRGLLLPLAVPQPLLQDSFPLGHLWRSFVPNWNGDLVGYAVGQGAGFLGLMAFAPPALVVTGTPGAEPLTFERGAKAVALGLGLVALTWTVFNRQNGSLLFLVLAGLVGAAFLVDFFGASLSVLSVGVLALCVQFNSLYVHKRTVLDTETLSFSCSWRPPRRSRCWWPAPWSSAASSRRPWSAPSRRRRRPPASSPGSWR